MKAYVKIRQAFCHAGVRAHSNEVTACSMSTSSLCKRKRCSLTQSEIRFPAYYTTN